MPLALVFTDIEGSTPLWERLGDRFRPSLDRHHAILRERLAANRGRELKTEGDAFMIAFASADDAVAFALGAQEGLAREEWPADVGELRVRMGMHWGDAIEIHDGGRTDYLGPMVNRAARIAQAAHGGQILMSESARAAAETSLDRAALRDLGEHRLRGLERRERLWSAVPASLPPREFPPIRSLSSVPTNLPVPASTFVGRDADVKALLEALAAPGARLVTVTGPGGTGKTRLALRAGAEALETYPGGVWFADLTEARDAAAVAHRAAEALGVPLGANADPVRAVGDALEFRKPLLLIADNFEQVVAAAPATVGAWLRRAPGLRVLATSRFLLGLEGERETALRPLPAPPPPGAPRAADVATLDAVRLFVERAREARPDFALTDANAADIAAICSELEGMPLALELAAARLRVLSPAEIRSRLRDRVGLLTSGRRDVTARQRSLDGAIAWSWDLLDPWERDAFAQLCAFRGGFFLEEAEAVLELPPGAPPPIDVVQALREKSFLRIADTPFGVRFGTYVALREFGESRGRAGWPELRAAALLARIGARLLAFARETDRRIASPAARAAIDRMEIERDNLLAAIERAGSPAERADLALACAHWLRVRGPLDVRVAMLERSRRELGAGEEERRAALGSAYAEALIENGRWDSAATVSLEAVAEARRTGNTALLARTLGTAALVQTRREGMNEGLRMRREQLDLARAVGDQRIEADALLGAGFCLQRLGGNEEGWDALAESVRVARKSGDPDLTARTIGHYALCRMGQDDHAVLVSEFEEARKIFESLGDDVRAVRVVASLGRLHRISGRLQDSLASHDAAVAGFRRVGHTEGLALTLAARANVLRAVRRFEDALADLDEAEAIHRTGEMSLRESGISCERAFIYADLMRIPEAEAAFAEAETRAIASRESSVLSRVYQGQGQIHFGRRNFAAAEGRFAESAAQARTAADFLQLAGVLQLLAKARASLGMLTEAEAGCTEAIRRSGELRVASNVCSALSLRSEIRLLQGRIAEALEDAKEAEAVGAQGGAALRGRHADALLALTKAEAAAGHAEASRDAARRAVEEARAIEVLSEMERIMKEALVSACESARAGLPAPEKAR